MRLATRARIATAVVIGNLAAVGLLEYMKSPDHIWITSMYSASIVTLLLLPVRK